MGPNSILDKGYQATTAIEQFRAVTLTSNDQVKRADAAAQATIGICQELITTDEATAPKGRIAAIRVMGISRCVAGAAVTRMTKVTTDSTGRIVPATTGQYAIGIAVEAASAAGDHFSVLLNQGLVG